MKRLITHSLLALISLSSAYAASLAESGDEALEHASKDGIIVFTYAEGWDNFSKPFALKLLDNTRIVDACGDASILSYPCYDTETEEQLAQLEKLRGKLAIPYVKSYPAIILFDSKGRHGATIQGQELLYATEAELASILQTRIKEIQKQSAILAQAKEKKGTEKAALLGAAADMSTLVAPEDYLKQITQLDPEDKTGYVRRFSINEWKMAEKVAALDNMPDIIKFVDSVLADDAYTVKVKQTAIARMLGLWRSLGTEEQIPQMKRYAQKMIDLDSSNYHAASAQYIMQHWLRPGGGGKPKKLRL